MVGCTLFLHDVICHSACWLLFAYVFRIYANHIRGLTGVATWVSIDIPSQYVEILILILDVCGLFRLRRYDTTSF